MLPHLWLCCEGGQQKEISESSIKRITKHLYFRGGLFWLMAIGFMFNEAQLATAQSPAYSAELLPNSVRPDGAGVEARIQILTRPIGALVFLDGEYSMTGRTPYTVAYFLKGPYRIRATRPGYENWETDYTFNGQGDDKLSIKLKPKTRYKALLWSAIFSGAGQVYSDHKTRGFVIRLMQFSAAGVSLYQHFKYNDALDDYNTALKNFQASQKAQDGQTDLIAQVRARKADLDDAYEIRKGWLAVTGLIYAYNLLDAVVFFPRYQRGALEVGVSLNQPPELHGAAVELNVKTKF